MALTLDNTDHVILVLFTDESGELQLRFQETSLADHGDHVVTISEDFPVRFEVLLADAVSHEDDEGSTQTWEFSQGHVHDFPSPTAGPLSVAVTGATGTTGETKKKVIYIETKPMGGLPDTGP